MGVLSFNRFSGLDGRMYFSVDYVVKIISVLYDLGCFSELCGVGYFRGLGGMGCFN